MMMFISDYYLQQMVVTVAAVDYGDVAIFVEATAVVVDLSGDTTVDQLV